MNGRTRGMQRSAQRPLNERQPDMRTYLALASLTRTLGRARSSRNRWLCSTKRRSLSSDIDCLCGRELMLTDSCLRDCTNETGVVRNYSLSGNVDCTASTETLVGFPHTKAKKCKTYPEPRENRRQIFETVDEEDVSDGEQEGRRGPN